MPTRPVSPAPSTAPRRRRTTRFGSRSRSRVTAALSALVVLVVLAGCAGTGAPVTPAVAFENPLRVPALLHPTSGQDGTKVFDLTAREGTSRFLTTGDTPTWGYNGDYLGPTLRARVGDRVQVNVHNALAEPTTVHWHGMHLPARMDGGPHQLIDPNRSWSPAWRIDQQPASLWYHPHPHGATEEQVYRGLAGFFLLDPATGPDPRLPHQYGVDDIPVAIQDKKLAADGQLIYDDGGNEIGLLGNLVLANGTPGAYHEVSTRLVRLRLLNGSTARSYSLGLDNGRAVRLVGTDGGLLEHPVALERVTLSPGERAEVVVELNPGERVRLRSFGADLGDVVAPGAFGAQDQLDVLELRAAAQLAPSPALPDVLAPVERLDPADAAAHREFVFQDRDINGVRMRMDRVDQTVTVDSTEIWQVRSRNPFPHNFHVHDVQFQVLSIDAGPPPPSLAGWKDTIYLSPHKTYRLIMRFEDYTDTNFPYMYHCHLLLHEDEGMMGQFVVVQPGQQARQLTEHSSH